MEEPTSRHIEDVAYVPAVAECADRDGFERASIAYSRLLGMDVAGISDVRPLPGEFVDDLESRLIEALQWLGGAIPVVFGTFQCYLDDESASD